MDIKELEAMTAQYVLHTARRLPVAWTKGRGVYLWDSEGKKYLDLLAGIAVNVLGYNHPRMIHAITQAATHPLHVTNLFQVPEQTFLAKDLVSLSFSGKVFFCNSGAEANETAVKIARKWGNETSNGRKNVVITTKQSFHGRTLAMLSATGQEKVRTGFQPLMPGFVNVPYGDLAALAEAITDETCAVMIEPLQGEGGIQIPPAGYLKGIKDLCQRHQILCIVDEIQTGMGRTGKFWAYQHEEIQPDIVALAKGLGGGVPIGAVLVRDEIAEIMTPGSHGGTFGGNPFVSRVARAVLKTIQEEDLVAQSADVGAYFLDRLKELESRHPLVHNARGKGLMLAIDLDCPARDLVLAGLENGLVLNAVQEKTLRFVPPLILQRKHVDESIDILNDILEAVP